MNAPAALQSTGKIEVGADGLLVAPSLERRRLQCNLAILLAVCSAMIVGAVAVSTDFLILMRFASALAVA